MTMLVKIYPTKKALREAIGKPLQVTETSIFGDEFRPNGWNTVARRPHVCGGGREFFARVRCENGIIKEVE